MKKHCVFLFVSLLVLVSCKKEKFAEDNYEYTGALGDIISIINETNYTPAQIQAILPTEISPFVTLKHNVTVYTVEYKSQNYFDDTVKASGIIIVPEVDSFAFKGFSNI